MIDWKLLFLYKITSNIFAFIEELFWMKLLDHIHIHTLGVVVYMLSNLT